MLKKIIFVLLIYKLLSYKINIVEKIHIFDKLKYLDPEKKLIKA